MSRLRTLLTQHGAEVGLAFAVVLTVAMMIVPLPTWLLDVLIATNLSFAVLVLVVALFVRDALAFGAFPTILLVTTLFRLALNVSATRLVLSQADAGQVIAAFGDFVVRGNYVVGAVVFAILTIIQLVVIARGAERVAEVGARFTLDAMPGKQLAIDADLRAGIIDANGALARRRALERESQLYGAMDGAMKFVKGDAIASIIIVLVNIVGGLAIGVAMRDMDVAQALQVYGRLTIGDGLTAQIPALLLSTAAGLVVTRVASEEAGRSLGRDLAGQIFGDWRALAVAASFAALLAIVPGLPIAPFGVLALVLATIAFALRRQPAPIVRDERAEGPIEIVVGAGATLDESTLAANAEVVRRELFEQLGVRLPAIAPVRSDRLRGDAYEIRVAGVRVDEGRIPSGRVFVRASVDELRELDPSVELDEEGGWIERSLVRDRATLTAADVIAARVRAAVVARPEVLFGIEETQRELDRLARDAPALVRTVVPDRVALPRLAALLRALVAERVRVRPLREILEALAQDPVPAHDAALVALVRERLARQLTHDLVREDGVLGVYALDPMLEDGIRDGLRPDGEPSVDPELARDLVDAVRRSVSPSERPVLVTQPDVRSALRRLLAPELPNVAIVSYRELDPTVQVRRLGVVGASDRP